MFSRLAIVSALALPLFAVATSVARQDGTPTTACCNSTESSNSATASALLGLLGIDLGSITGLIGLDCSPISAVGVGSGSECSSNTINCSNGLIGSVGIGCVPVSI